MYDLLFRKAKIIDGTGNPWFWGDVGIEGDRITGLGDLSGATAKRTLDLDGLALAPGFIDLHTHSDFTMPLYPRADSMVRQGVTTQLVGNCGFSPFPVAPERLEELRSYAAFIDAGLGWDWQDAASYAAMLGSLPLASNVALQVGHGTVRIAVMGFEQREPSPSELAAMEKLVAAAMEQGAFALSTGLIYVPGSYSRTEELVALAKVAARYGGFYSSHIRGEGDTLLDAVSEAITVGKEAGMPVQLSHHKATGQANWGKVGASLELLDAARAAGQDVLADQYPYTAGSTTLAALLPTWALAGGTVEMVRRLTDPATRARIRAELVSDEPEAGSAVGQFEPETVMLSFIPAGPNKIYEGLMLTECASQQGLHPIDAALNLLASEAGGVQMITFSMAEEDVRRVMRHPAVAVASDGWTLHPASGGKPHPRSYSTYARVLGKYVREEQVLSLEEAVRKMTSLPARRLGRYDLGLVRPGGVADLVVFDPSQVADRATFQEPHQYCAGVSYVVVNGQPVIENGQDTGAKVGRVLRRR
jgi:N-acyl-D-amino-acid deacylase